MGKVINELMVENMDENLNIDEKNTDVYINLDTFFIPLYKPDARKIKSIAIKSLSSSMIIEKGYLILEGVHNYIIDYGDLYKVYHEQIVYNTFINIKDNNVIIRDYRTQPIKSYFYFNDLRKIYINFKYVLKRAK